MMESVFKGRLLWRFEIIEGENAIERVLFDLDGRHYFTVMQVFIQGFNLFCLVNQIFVDMRFVVSICYRPFPLNLDPSKVQVAVMKSFLSLSDLRLCTFELLPFEISLSCDHYGFTLFTEHLSLDW